MQSTNASGHGDSAGVSPRRAVPEDEKSSLLHILRAERGPVEPERGGRKWVWMGAVATAIAVGGALFYWWPSEAVPVRVAVAQSVRSSTPATAAILDASGYIVPRRQATVSARIVGRVSDILIEEGQTVATGDVIARLDDSEMQATLAQAMAQKDQAEANVRAARVAFEVQRSIFERQTKQYAARLISAQDFDNSKATFSAAQSSLDAAIQGAKVSAAQLGVAQQNLSETVIRAPFSGVVTVKAAQPGEIVSPSSVGGFTRTGICTIVDMDSLELEVDISENFIHRVSAQQPASIVLNAYPDFVIPGEVLAVVPTADRAKSTVKVRVGLKVKDARIVPEMGAKVTFLRTPDEETSAPARSNSAVLVPADSVTSRGANARHGQVLVVVGDRVQRRTVALGARTTQGQLVLSGLQPQEEVVIGQVAGLDDASKVRVDR